MRTAKELRDIAEKVCLRKQQEAERGRATREEEFEKEIATCLSQITSEIEKAAHDGKMKIRIPAIRTDIEKLSREAVAFLVDKLQQKNYSVHLVCGESFNKAPLTLKRPDNGHDLEGWAEYWDELYKYRNVFISSLAISW